jgi:hypothetical protein
MKKESGNLIIGFIIGIVLGVIICSFLFNLNMSKEKKYDIFYIDEHVDLKGFKEINMTSEVCYNEFINERIQSFENPYNSQDFECSIINVTFWRFEDIRSCDYDIVGYTTNCKCWKK